MFIYAGVIQSMTDELHCCGPMAGQHNMVEGFAPPSNGTKLWTNTSSR